MNSCFKQGVLSNELPILKIKIINKRTKVRELTLDF